MKSVVSQPRKTADSFRNAKARMGWGEDNPLSDSRYVRDYLSRDWQMLTSMYRNSWVVGVAVDSVAEDMVKAGIEITGPIKPDDAADLIGDMRRMLVNERLMDTIKWARLYGGAVAVLLIDGQDMSTPLRLETVEPGQFKGLLALDRWMLQPSITDLVTEFGPDLGLPRYYGVLPSAPALHNQWVHYTRVVRMDGISLPYQDARAENSWGQSIVERLFDRLVAFDSATTGAAQLTFRSWLRIVRMKGLRQMIGQGGKALEAVTAHLDFIRSSQTNEGLTVLDADDDFATNTYAFSGLDSVLSQMGQQISGAIQVPLVRLFGQSPSGFSSGDTDLRNYYDGVDKSREARLRDPMQTILDLLYRNRFQRPIDPGVGFTFNSLWQMTPEQRMNVAQTGTNSVVAAHSAGIITDRTALSELRQLSMSTGVFTNITNEEIAEASAEPPKLVESEETGGEDLEQLGG